MDSKKNETIKGINKSWLSRDKKHKRDFTHPWNNTNSYIKAKQEKIWTSDITPENERK